MLTIKIQSWDEEYPIKDYSLEKGVDQPARQTWIHEGRDIYHRQYQMKSFAEFKEWKDRYTGGPHLHVIGLFSITNKVKFEKILNDQLDKRLEFGFLTFINDDDEDCHQCIIYGSNVYIMNEQGQTIEQFAT